ncbi:hypothetical protein [Rubritalea tangerina]|uniref:DUF304 domain-containing protein n=1 Tax=Rubritalea tangerina TaxID=430798 RepID=A0ABW4ZES7_9BACT
MPEQNTAHSPNFLKKLFGSAPQNVAESHKELRFTRARQAAQFFLLSAFFLILAIGSAVALFASWGPDDPDYYRTLPYCLIPILPALLLLRLAHHCIRHAYLILTPMGVEVFPFFKPQQNLQVFFWAEIHEATITPNTLTLHTDAEHTSGAVITLKPLTPQQISLLQHAIEARTTNN